MPSHTPSCAERLFSEFIERGLHLTVIYKKAVFQRFTSFSTGYSRKEIRITIELYWFL